jgi:hypothetical protein
VSSVESWRKQELVLLMVRHFREKGERGKEKERFDSDGAEILYDERLCTLNKSDFIVA